MANEHADIAANGWQSIITRIKRAVSWRWVLSAHIMELQKQVLELQRTVNRPTLQALMDEIVTMRSEEITRLTNDAVKALRLLIDTGVITQEQANEAIR